MVDKFEGDSPYTDTPMNNCFSYKKKKKKIEQETDKRSATTTYG